MFQGNFAGIIADKAGTTNAGSACYTGDGEGKEEYDNEETLHLKGDAMMKQALVKIVCQVAKLIDVKSLVTLSLVAALVVMTTKGTELPALFSNAVMLVLGFFFGKNVKPGQEEV